MLSTVLSHSEYPELEGLILQRGGEQILLQKRDDRLTVRFSPDTQDTSRVLRQVGAEMARSIPAASLLELRVGARRLEQAMRILRRSPEVEFVSRVYHMPREPETPIFLSNQITVQFQPEITAYQIESIVAAMGLQVVKLVAGIPKAFVFQLTKRSPVNPLKITNRLLQTADILLAEPNIILPLQDVPFWTPASIDLPEKITPGSQSTIIALVSGSINLNHAAFQGIGKIVAPWAAEPAHEEQGSSATSAGFEETRLSEAVLSEIDRVAPDCAFMPLQIGHFLDDQLVEQVLEWAMRHKAAVIAWECEAATNYYPLSLRQRVAVQQAAIQGRNGKGCVIVVAGAAIATSDRLNGFAVHPDVLVVPGGLSPSVSGVVALMLSANSDLSAQQVRQIWQADSIAASKPLLDSASNDRPVSVMKAIHLAQQQARPAPIATRWLEAENLEPVQIPDNDPQGITNRIQIETASPILDVVVTVHLEHEFIGDLELFLISPQGDSILLQSRNLGRLNLLRTDYSLETVPYLKSLLYRSAQGVWQLQIIDRAPAHMGELKGWRLRIGLAD